MSRKRPLPAPPSWSGRFYVRLAPADLACFKFLLEGYDNLAFLSVVDKYESVVQIVFSPPQEGEVRRFLDAAKETIDLAVMDFSKHP